MGKLTVEGTPDEIRAAQSIIINTLSNVIMDVDQIPPEDRTADKLAENAKRVLHTTISTRSVPPKLQSLSWEILHFLLYKIGERESAAFDYPQ